MAKNQKGGAKAGKAASKVLRDGRYGMDSKSTAGSTLSQRPVTKRGKLSEADADRAVRTYLSTSRK